MDKLEQLKSDVNELKKSLYELKNNVSLSDIEKKNKAKTLKAQAETTKHRIQNKILLLEDKTDDESKKEKEEAEALLNSFNEIISLYTSILDSTKSKHTQQNAKEKKWFFWKLWEWLWNMWNDVTTLNKWKEQPLKNFLYAGGTVLTWYALAKWIKKLRNWTFWNNDKKEKEKKNIKKKWEWTSFRKTGRWNFLKWTWITTATWWWIYGISRLIWKNRNEKKKENEKKNETIQKWWDEISESMFQQLLLMEWSQSFVAKTHSKKFWENFATWPYWMVYKHIDKNGNLLNKPVPFKDGERVNQTWAEKNARAYYNKRAKEWSSLLKWKWYTYTQEMLDALVSASWWTEKSVKSLKNFILSHRDDKNAIFNFMSKFATTAACNGKVMPWLVTRRKFEANRFAWTKHPYSDYQKHLA